MFNVFNEIAIFINDDASGSNKNEDDTRDKYKLGVIHTLRKYYYKTAQGWLEATPPRKVVDNPSGDIYHAPHLLGTSHKESFFYPITDTEPCSQEEADRLLNDPNRDNVSYMQTLGCVWWRELTDAEQVPGELIWDIIKYKLGID